MAIPTMQDDLDIIAGLGDSPNTDNNLSEEQLKAKFDEGPKAIKAFINTYIVPAINKLIGAVGFTGAHGDLTGRDAENQHPITAITGLVETLNSKAAGNHNHNENYAAKDHNHDTAYSASGHNHDGSYLKVAAGVVSEPVILKRGVHYGTETERPEAPVEGQMFLKLTRQSGGSVAAEVESQAYGAESIGDYSASEVGYAGYNGSVYYGYVLRFSVGNLPGDAVSLNVKLWMHKGIGNSATLRYALCTSDENKENYVGVSDAVEDAYQIKTGTVTFEELSTARVANNITVETDGIAENSTYYLFLWAYGDTGVSIEPVSSAWGDHSVEIDVNGDTYYLTTELFCDGYWVTDKQEG